MPCRDWFPVDFVRDLDNSFEQPAMFPVNTLLLLPSLGICCSTMRCEYNHIQQGKKPTTAELILKALDSNG